MANLTIFSCVNIRSLSRSDKEDIYLIQNEVAKLWPIARDTELPPASQYMPRTCALAASSQFATSTFNRNTVQCRRCSLATVILPDPSRVVYGMLTEIGGSVRTASLAPHVEIIEAVRSDRSDDVMARAALSVAVKSSFGSAMLTTTRSCKAVST